MSESIAVNVSGTKPVGSTLTKQRPQPKNDNGQQYQLDKPRNNSKLVCLICGKIRHCRNRVPGGSAYRNASNEKQYTTENREFRREFKQFQNDRQPAYQVVVTQPTEQPTQTEVHNDCYDVEYNDKF